MAETLTTDEINRIAQRAHDNHSVERMAVAPTDSFLSETPDGREATIIDVANEMVHELAVAKFLRDNAESAEEYAHWESLACLASEICDTAVSDF